MSVLDDCLGGAKTPPLDSNTLAVQILGARPVSAAWKMQFPPNSGFYDVQIGLGTLMGQTLPAPGVRSASLAFVRR